MTDVADTSLEAYNSIYDGLGRKQRKVYDIINCYGPYSNEEIALRLCWPINSVTGRVKELRDMQLVFQHSTKINDKGRSVRVWTTTKPKNFDYELE